MSRYEHTMPDRNNSIALNFLKITNTQIFWEAHHQFIQCFNRLHSFTECIMVSSVFGLPVAVSSYFSPVPLQIYALLTIYSLLSIARLVFDCIYHDC